MSDGLKVAANRGSVVAAGLAPGADILNELGKQVARIQINHRVENVTWT